MLTQMRKYSKSLVSSIFLGALAVSFVVWGVADIFKGGADDTVLRVGSTKISVSLFSRDFHNALKGQRTVLDADQTKQVGQAVLDHMGLATALDNLAASLGLTASDARVDQQIQAIPAFAGPSGSFDPSLLASRLQSAGYGLQEFREITRKGTARSQMLHGVESGFQLPPDYARAVFAYVNETRAADYVVLTPAALGTIAAPSDAELTAYVKAHPERFSTPEYRSVDYAALNADDIAPSIKVTDAQIQEEIDGNKSQYIVPEKRTLEQIQFPSEADARAAKAALDGGKSFDALAAERKLKGADYKLGDVVAADLDKPRADAFFALKEGGTSAPVRSTFGWVLMHNVKITAGSAKTHDQVKLILQRKLAVDKMTDAANVFTDALGSGASMEEAAHKAKMRFFHVAAIDEQGLAPNGSKALEPANPELLAAIFKAEAGDDGDPFPTEDGLHYFAVKVNGVTPPHTRTLDQVRVIATSRWHVERQVELLRKRAEALAAKANAEHSLAGVAQALGAPVQSSQQLNRGTNLPPNFTPAVMVTLFKAAPGQVVAAPTLDGNYVLLRITGINHPLPPEGNIGYQRGVAQLGGEVTADITTSLGRAVQQRDGMKVNQKLVDTTVGNSGSGS